MREVLHELMYQREIHRLDGDVGRRVVERRRPYEHASETDLALDGRRSAIVVAREHAIRRSGLDGSVAEEMRGREVAAARRLEHFEHRMAVIEESERAAAARRAIGDRTK